MSGRRGRHPSRRLLLAIGVCTSLIASSLFVPPASAAPGDSGVAEDRSVPVTDLAAKVPPLPKTKSFVASPVVWPTSGSAVVTLPAAANGMRSAGSGLIGGLPVKVLPAASNADKALQQGVADTPSHVRVEVVPGALAQRGAYPLALRLSRADGSKAASRVRVEVDYSAFRGAYGAEWDNRLTLVTLPGCALTTPQVPACLQSQQLQAENRYKAGVLSADVILPSGEAAEPPLSDKQAALEGIPAAGKTGPTPVVLGMVAAAASDTGDYTKTDFKSTYTWQAGGSGGAFSWSYPMEVPPVPGAFMPKVELNYSSGGVDGQTVGVNVQPFWGEGWNYTPGFVERSYRACKDDTANSPIYTITTSDSCWRLPNARMVLGGKSVELILGDDGKWRTENDDAAKVELLTGDTETHNWNDEHWKVTTVDGTQYHFGLSRLPGWTAGDRETSAVLGAPVFSNHPGEPCIDAQGGGGWTNSWCSMAYRWNLDYVVDRNGNTMSLWYTKEINRTALAGNASVVAGYDRFGLLDRIEYGTRSGTGATRESAPNATPPARVVFTNADRCIAADCSPNVNWPDTPWDLKCDAAPCSNNMTPSFWSTKRVAQIATEVWSGSGTTYNRVDEWALGAEFPADASGNPLWLSSITRTGKVGGSTALPSMLFTGTTMQNRADYDPSGTMANPYKYRITSVRTESGGQIDVAYSTQETGCLFGAPFPDPDTNTKRCFPRYWTNPSGSSGWAWWHKYVVTKVVEKDLVVPGSLPVEYNYTYTTDGASTPVLWAHDDGAMVFTVSNSYKSWADWRGYPTVTTTTGTDAGQQSQTKTLYFRGLKDDGTDAGEFTRASTITNSEAEVSEDYEQFAGMAHETQTLDGPGGQVLTKRILDPARYLTGTRTLSSNWTNPTRFYSYIGRTTRERSKTWLPLSSSWQTTEKVSQWNTAYGVIDKVDDLGGSSNVDDVCTRYSYTFPAAGAPYLIAYPNRVEKVGVNCATAPVYPADALSDVRSFFDNAASFITAPTKGNVTKIQSVASFTGSTANPVTMGTNVYDTWGRPTSVKDPLNYETKTVYTHTAGLVSSLKVTNPKLHDTVTTIDRFRGLPLTTTDPNNKVTTGQYDPLGRLQKVWRPGHPTSGTPDKEYQYQLQQGAPSFIRLRLLGPNGNLIDSYEIYDGLLRPRQTQTTAPNLKRSVVDTIYDKRGLMVKKTSLYNSASGPTGTLVAVDDAVVDRQVRFVYDQAGRQTHEQAYARNVKQFETVTSYQGDRTGVIPPAGGTVVQDLFDARGQLMEKRQYQGSGFTGAFDKTSYEHDEKGQLTKVTDPAGNIWAYEYDLLGRQTKVTDPDAGVRTNEFDNTGQLTKSTDGRNKAVAYTWDELGRRTAVYDTSTAGTKLAEWAYDTVDKGQLATSTRFEGGQSYITTVGSYDEGYRPESTTFTVPGFGASGTTLTYTVNSTYKTDGQVATQALPGVGGLPSETVTAAYSNAGLATTLSSGSGTYVGSTTYAWDGVVTERKLGAAGKQVRQRNGYQASTGRLTSLNIDTENQTTPNTFDNKFTSDLGYNNAGSITKIAGKTNGTTDQVECFQYDYLRRLTKAWTQTSTTCAATPQRIGADPYWREWTFEANGGQRKTQLDKGATTPEDTNWTYTYPTPGTGDPHALSRVDASGPKAGTAVRTSGYDGAGNTTSRTTETGAAQTLTWNQEGQLATVVQGSQTTSFVYDADGNRLIRKDPTGDTLYLPDGTEIKKLSGGQIDGTRYYSAGGIPVAVRKGTALSWICSDHHGTGQIQIDSVTLTTSRRRLLPYGETRSSSGTWTGDRGYVGGTNDPSTGLTHLGAREYDSSLGRFISVDPIMDLTDPQQWHAYTYANNSPVHNSDPSGAKVCGDSECGGGGGYNPEHPIPAPKPIPRPLPGPGAGGPGQTPLGTPSPQPSPTPLPITCIGSCPISMEMFFLQLIWGFVPYSDAPECASDGGWACAGVAMDTSGFGKVVSAMAGAAVLFGKAIIRNGGDAARAGRGVWDIDPFERGRQIEQWILEERGLPTNQLAPNQPVIDAFQGGTATSIKSVDLQTFYKRDGSLQNKLRSDIRALSNFQDSVHGGVVIKPGDIQRRSLIVAIPSATVSSNHLAAMVDAYRYGAERGVSVSFVVVMG